MVNVMSTGQGQFLGQMANLLGCHMVFVLHFKNVWRRSSYCIRFNAMKPYLECQWLSDLDKICIQSSQQSLAAKTDVLAPSVHFLSLCTPAKRKAFRSTFRPAPLEHLATHNSQSCKGHTETFSWFCRLVQVIKMDEKASRTMECHDIYVLSSLLCSSCVKSETKRETLAGVRK